MATILTREHPNWDDFVRILTAIVNIHEVAVPGEEEPELQWTCHGDLRQSIATIAFMETLDITEDIDVDGTISYFQANGGYCDCEVLFNVVTDEEADESVGDE